MKSWDEINVDEIMPLEDFLILFGHLPLLEEEKQELTDFYYPMYTTFLTSEVNPADAWIATRNVFTIKNQQIAERIKTISTEDI